MRRRLTKKEKFDIDILYRPYLIKERSKRNQKFLYSYEKNLETLSHLRILEIFSNNCEGYFNDKDKDEFYLFLSDYADLLNWTSIFQTLLNITYRYKDTINFIDLFKEYFDSKCWNIISRSYMCYDNDNLIRKFKDKLNWEIITRYHHWNDLNFLLEMKEYVDIFYLFGDINVRGDLRSYILPYVEEHFEEILKYAISKKELIENGK